MPNHRWGDKSTPSPQRSIKHCQRCGMICVSRHERDERGFPLHWKEYFRGTERVDDGSGKAGLRGGGGLRMTVVDTPSLRPLIVDMMARYRLPLSDEKHLQSKIAEMLTMEKVPFVREVRLDDDGKDIVDFMVGSGALLQPLGQACAIEVKIGGSRRAIFRQVERYCQHPQVAEIVLATAVPMALPFEINGKRTAIAHLGRAWL